MPSTTTIPHPPRRVPILGDVFGIDPETPNQTTLVRFEELGPIYRRSILGTDLTFVGSPDLAAEIFDESTWEKFVGRPLEQLRPLVGDGLFTAYSWESNWSKAHEVLMPAFTKESMVSYHDTMVAVTDELCAHLSSQEGAPVPVVDAMGGLTLEVIGRCGFGYSFDSFHHSDHPFVAALTRSLTYAQKSGIPIPFIGKLLRRTEEKQNTADRALLVETVDGVIAERQRTGERRNDLLDRMLHPEGDVTLDPENIRNQVLTFLIAGHETSVNSLSFAFHFLAQHPDVAEKVRAEASQVFGENVPKYEDVARLRYTRQVISEAMRIWPAAPGFFRAAKQDTTVGEYAFAEGEWAFVLLLAVQRDKKAWGEDADQFNPDRFSPENTRGRAAELFKPFGTGIRSCIGRQFALHEMALAIATVLTQFSVTAEPGYELEVEETLTLRPKNLKLSFTPR